MALWLRSILPVIVCGILSPGSPVVADDPTQSWKQHVVNQLSPFEAAGVADFNQDGKLDIFSGDSWYAAPNWESNKVRDVPKGTNPHYYEDFADAPLDVNGDGHMDIVTCAYFSKKVAWLEHPGDAKKPWTEHLIDTPGSMETGYLLSLKNSSQPVFIPNVGGKVMYYELTATAPKVEWTPRVLSSKGAGHGIGHGDINGDGRIDLVTPKGWYEQPPQLDGNWEFHPEFELGTASIEIIGHDFDGDGDTDIVWGMGHDFGLQWLKQGTVNGQRTWTKEEIDKTFSQVHTLHLADFDGNGELEFVTGKRIYAHASEPGATEEPCIYIIAFDRKSSKWIRSTVHRGEPAPAAPMNPEHRDAMKDFRPGSAGTGLQMVVRDMDSDGDIDIVAPGKSGLYWFENLRLPKR